MPESSAAFVHIKTGRVFPLWLKIAAAIYLCGFIVIQSVNFGFSNFLWFSCLGLIGATVALLLENRLLASMMLLMVFMADGIGWGSDFLIALLTGWHPFNGTRYMFDDNISLFIRAMSLFHLVVPAMLVWMVYKLRYDPRAFAAQSLFAAVILLISYNLTDPVSNINLVYGVTSAEPQTLMHPWLYLAVVMAYVTVMFYLPVHLILRRIGWHRMKEKERRNNTKKHETI